LKTSVFTNDLIILFTLFVVFLVYALRRVDCKRCGVTVEAVPWSSGKMQTTHALVWFLSSWAKALSWKETARRFRTSWDTVYPRSSTRWAAGFANATVPPCALTAFSMMRGAGISP